MSNLVFTNIVGAVTCLVGVIGMRLSGDNKRVGWMIALLSEALWVFYAVILQQWTLIPACFVWAGVYLRNWRKWGKGDLDLRSAGGSSKVVS